MSESEKLFFNAKKVRFFSEKDEDYFFKWLDDISCVAKYEGAGTSIIIEIEFEMVDASNLRELISIFRRYDIPMSQLIVFDREDFSDWYRDPNSFWYEEIFGS